MPRRDGLYNAFILVKCTSTNHKNCMPIQDALMDNFKGVLQSYATDTNIEGTRYCITANALVKSSEVETFEKKLKSMKAGPKGQIGIKDLKILVPNS